MTSGRTQGRAPCGTSCAAPWHGRDALPWLSALLALGSLAAFAQEKKADVPRITALAPFALVPGATTTVKIRGVKLAGATAVKLPDSGATIGVEMKEKKAAEVPNGADAKEVGDSQVEVKLTVPAELPAGPLALSVVTPEGTTASREVQVLAACADEKEPNNGWRAAQMIACGQPLRGTLGSDKDVDVFQFTGKAAQRVTIEVFAARGPSLLDPVLTVHDTRGHVLASADDSAGRDPQLALTLPADGAYLITVQDAHDRGGAWHGYTLKVDEAP